MAKRNHLCSFSCLCILLLALTGCSSFGRDEGNTDSLEGVQQLSQGSASKNAQTLNAMRYVAIQEIALTTAAQAGLAAQAKSINMILERNQANLDQAFNFNLMMLEHNVLPPVLVQGDNSLNLDDNNTIRISDRTYQIASQARFVTTPPTWRTYLWLNYNPPESPEPSLLPKNAKERSIWKKYTAIGWQNGTTQANNIYYANLSLLKRDFTGMVRYRVLLAQHMVSAPSVARTELGITGDGTDMRVNDQVLRITALPTLRTNSKTWKPVVRP